MNSRHFKVGLISSTKEMFLKSVSLLGPILPSSSSPSLVPMKIQATRKTVMFDNTDEAFLTAVSPLRWSESVTYDIQS